jgi:phenylpyruvate tautomerase PptA (4-oxalocrotonate tautomerase family)
MPLVRIDINRGRTRRQVRAICDAIHSAIVEVFEIPERDRFQVVSQLDYGSIIAEDAGLGFDRSEGVVMIQIFTQRGRSDQQKQHLYARIAANLTLAGVLEQDIFIGYQENGPSDWSFGFGAAQYLTGELKVPTSQPS